LQEPSSPVRLDRDGPVARLVLNRPDVLNALDVASARALLAACEAVAADDGVRVLVVAGDGRAFMTGGDINAFQGDDPRPAIDDIIRAAHAAITILRRLDLPVVASLHGAVAGFGLSLSLACDLAIAAEGTRFGLAYSKIGTSLDGGSSFFLPRIVGLRRAMEIALLAETFDAAEALRLGIVNKVVPAASLADETMVLARRLAEGPTFAYGRIKRLLHDGAGLEQQLERERLSFLDCAATDDFAEGVASFLAKRRPVFHGR
jgi:2-(1,2-epoxy-1,2-dihydrophenyl)acetyl-CoA isomerase